MMLNDKVVIVTGASSGIGRAAALLFSSCGARVVAAGRRRDELDRLASEISAGGGEVAVLAGDVRDAGHHEGLVALALQRFGGLDAAFNNAGSTGPATALPDLADADWHATIDTNLTAAYLAARCQIPALIERGGGALLFTASFVGYSVGFPGMAAYGAAKAGVIGLVKGLAAEYGPHKIRVNALLPGGTDTPMGRETVDTPDKRRFVEGLHALKRLAEPEEIAQAALFLLSDAASFTTGTALLADGGVSVNRA